MATAEKNCLVIVESPTKARTIRKFLPKNFRVEASMGHIRDLPQSAADIPTKYKKEEWAKLGVNTENNFEPLYVTPKGKGKIIKELRLKLKEADELYLATDEDREGESISWHLIETLKPKIPVKRMVFHEITKNAINKALKECRDIDIRLVRAQETRRILDRLVGYTLSPLLWKKIAYGLSAGRVQSSGLRLIVVRERARLRFKKGTYWDLLADLNKSGEPFQVKLTTVDNTKIAIGKDFDESTGKLKAGKNVKLLSEKDARDLASKLQSKPWIVSDVEEKGFNLKPLPPFITSSLQQEANRKLRFSARDTMRVAQRLYEEGWITYMRTDSPTLSSEGLQAARTCAKDLYGDNYLSPQPRQFTAKSKAAQEAHEAIRPASAKYTLPKDSGLTGDHLKLYDLIWKRTVASQMKEAEKASITAHIKADNCTFTANGTRIIFPGFLKAYVEGSDDPEKALEDKEVLLPSLNPQEEVALDKLEATSHETKPPARFTEASLIQALEKGGVGRPSTYASIIQTIMDRGYVKKVGNALVPSFTAFAVIQLLEKHFENLVDLGFTSKMEESLDEIAAGNLDWLPYLEKFYLGKSGLRQQVQDKEDSIETETSRSIQIPQLENIEIRVGRYGPYIIKQENGDDKDKMHVSIPEDVSPADLNSEKADELFKLQEQGPLSIGKYPETNQDIYVFTGRYGPYVQLGEVTEDKPKPKRSSLPKGISPQSITLDQAITLISLPKELGKHPESKEPIMLNQGRFGPYISHDGDNRSLKKDDSIFTMTFERSLEILSEEKRSRRGSKLVRDLGKHPKDEKSVAIYDGRYGLYIKYGTKNVKFPEDKDAEKITLEEALELIAAKKTTKKKRHA